MKMNKIETTIDINEMIKHILEEEKDVAAINCPKSVKDTSASFEHTQKCAGMISDLTWNVVWKEDSAPVVSRKSGDFKPNLNYSILCGDAGTKELAKAYTDDCGREIVLALQKHRLEDCQCLAYVKDNKLYMMFNGADKDGNRIDSQYEERLMQAFA